MGKWRKKPSIVEAFQWREPEDFDAKTRPLPKGVWCDFSTGKWRFHVVTIHGQKAWLADGDWIIEEPDGEHHYPCKPDIFAETYEKVEG